MPVAVRADLSLGGVAMWRNIKVVFAASVVTLSLGMTIASSFGQSTTRDNDGVRTTTTRDNNDGFNLGWMGLIGLAGLVGLMPRTRRDHNEHDLKR